MPLTASLLIACLLLALPTAGSTAPWRLSKVQMVSRSSGWALAATPRGSVVLRTTDGGADWRNVSPKGIWPLSSAQIAANDNYGIGLEGIDCCALTGQTCWVAMINKSTQIIIERTHDGGRHWEQSQFANHTGYWLLLSLLDNRHGWVLTVSDMASGSTAKELLGTKDGGRTWATVSEEIPNHIDPHGATFRNTSVGWLTAGYHGSDEMPFYRTDDGGRHWHVLELDTSAALQSDERYENVYPPSFFGPKQRDGLLPVQFRSLTSPTGLYRTRDGGNTWRMTALIPGLGRADTFQFLSLKRGWIMEDAGGPTSRLLRTQDGGKRWHVVYPKQRKQ